jgi:hypothetical protein
VTSLAPAARIVDADQALAVAAELAEEFAAGAAARDAGRDLPHEQVRALKAAGLLALSVPVEHGGIDAPASVIAEVFRLLAHADASLAQIPHSHYTFLRRYACRAPRPSKSFSTKRCSAGRFSPMPSPNARAVSTSTPRCCCPPATVVTGCRGANSIPPVRFSPIG